MTNREMQLAIASEDSEAVISECGKYRYWLSRRWAPGPTCVFIMLNPSTADASKNDNTIRKCIGFAKAWGFSAFVVVNLFAFRATDPREMKRQTHPVGPLNDLHILRALHVDPFVVCAWGGDGNFRGRADEVRRQLRSSGVTPQCLGVSLRGEPFHPRLVSYSTPLRDYQW